MSKIDVMHLRDGEKVGGPGKTILESCRATDRSKFHLIVAVFVPAQSRKNELIDEAQKRGFAAIAIPMRGSLDLRVVYRLAKIVRERHIKILHTHDYKSNIIGFLASRIANVVLVTTVHGWISNSLRAKAHIFVDKFVIRLFDRIIAVSAQMKTDLAELAIPRRKLTLIHNAIVLDDYSNIYDSQVIRKEFGLSPETKLVGIIGRLSTEKGHRYFLFAAARIVGSLPLARFLIVGDGPDRISLEMLAQHLGIRDKVIFTGYRNDMKHVYTTLDIVVLSSLSEGLPNVILEALALRKPVVATNVGGVSELIYDGKTGLLLPPRDPLCLADSVIFLLKHPEKAQQMGCAGRKLVENRFSFENRTRKMESIYMTLASQKGSERGARLR